MKIYTLGRFSLMIDDEPVEFARKAPRKPLALLEFLIAAGGGEVSSSQLMDALWPDEEGDAARKAFDVALHRLRKILRHPNALRMQEGLVTLNPDVCWVDAWAFGRTTARIEAAPNINLSAADLAQLEQALSLYQGNFLITDQEISWTASLRERLRSHYVRLVLLRAARLLEDNELEAAIDCYHKGIAVDDLAEEFYQGLMRCYQRLARAPTDSRPINACIRCFQSNSVSAPLLLPMRWRASCAPSSLVLCRQP